MTRLLHSPSAVCHFPPNPSLWPDSTALFPVLFPLTALVQPQIQCLDRSLSGARQHSRMHDEASQRRVSILCLSVFEISLFHYKIVERGLYNNDYFNTS